MSIDIKEALIMFSQLSEWAYKQQAITAAQADENVKRLDELDRLARLAAAVEAMPKGTTLSHECDPQSPDDSLKPWRFCRCYEPINDDNADLFDTYGDSPFEALTK